MKFNKQELRKAAEKATEGNYVVGHSDINKHGNLSSVYVCQEWNGMAGGVVAECHVNCLTKNSDLCECRIYGFGQPRECYIAT